MTRRPARRSKPRTSTEGRQAKRNRATPVSEVSSGKSSRLGHAEKAEILAAAVELGSVGSLRVVERLKREIAGERLFAERLNAMLARIESDTAGLEHGSAAWLAEQKKAGQAPFAVLLELAQESVEKGYPNSSVSPVEILESPSARDYLGVLIARRREDYSGVGGLPDRIAGALFCKSKGGHPPKRIDQIFDSLKMAHFRVVRRELGQLARLIRAALLGGEEILQSILEQGRVLHPPDDGLPPERTPPGYREQQERNYNRDNLPRLARHLSEYRRTRRERKVKRDTLGTLDDHAIQIVLEGWAPDARYGPISALIPASGILTTRQRLVGETEVAPDMARKELVRLKRNSNRRKKSRT